VPEIKLNRRAWIVALTGVGSLMAALDTLVVSTALRSISDDLGATVQQLEWTVNSYNLTFAVLLISAAALGDRFGRRRLFAAGLVLFSAASAGCALAPDVQFLIFSRAVQGAGAALLMPLGLALLAQAFPPEQRGAAIGVFSAITGLAVASGPLVGGLVINGLSWHWIFWLNVPIGAVAAPLALLKMDEVHGPETSVDRLGLLLISAGSFALVWALVRGNDAGWSSPEIVATLLAGVLVTAAFALWQTRARTPMLAPDLFRSRSFNAGNAAIFLTFASLFTGVFFFSQLLQIVLGHDALGAGLRLLPWTLTFLTIAPAAGALADRIGERWLLSAGLTLQAAGLLWLAEVADPAMTYSSLLGPFITAGVGISMAIPCAQNAVVGHVRDRDIGKAAGVNSMMRELGGVFGIAVTVAVFSRTGTDTSPGLFIDGFRPAVATAAGFALVGALCGLATPGRQPARRPADGPDLPVAAAVAGMDPSLPVSPAPIQ
jgi:EmrB/QacA subfamily drug resistance transporter